MAHSSLPQHLQQIKGTRSILSQRLKGAALLGGSTGWSFTRQRVRGHCCAARGDPCHRMGLKGKEGEACSGAHQLDGFPQVLLFLVSPYNCARQGTGEIDPRNRGSGCRFGVRECWVLKETKPYLKGGRRLCYLFQHISAPNLMQFGSSSLPPTSLSAEIPFSLAAASAMSSFLTRRDKSWLQGQGHRPRVVQQRALCSAALPQGC